VYVPLDLVSTYLLYVVMDYMLDFVVESIVVIPIVIVIPYYSK
jgi:hypothetical protein